jgi:hypothetical protein
MAEPLVALRDVRVQHGAAMVLERTRNRDDVAGGGCMHPCQDPQSIAMGIAVSRGSPGRLRLDRGADRESSIRCSRSTRG